MRPGTLVLTLAGLGLVAALLMQVDDRAVLAVVSQVGWAVLAVLTVRCGVVAIAGLGWAPLIVDRGRATLPVVVGLRFVREAVNVLLPVATVGGDLVGGRLLTRWSVSPGTASASIISDLLLQSVAQLLFTVAGLAVLVWQGRGAWVVSRALPGLGIAGLALAGFFATQRLGLFRLLEAGLASVARRWPAAGFAGELRLHENLRIVYARPGAVLLSVTLHVGGWLLGTLETLAVLAAAGVATTFGQALVIECIGQAVRGLAFPVPGALGAQEGGYVVAGSLYGIPPETCLALSFIKRVPDAVIGMPGLLAWLLLESGRIGPSQPRPLEST